MRNGQLTPVGHSAGNWRYMAPDGRVFCISYDGLVRDGGSGGWYVVAIVDGERLIDGALVPEEHYRTLRQARAALEEWLAEPKWSPPAGLRELKP